MLDHLTLARRALALSTVAVVLAGCGGGAAVSSDAGSGSSAPVTVSAPPPPRANTGTSGSERLVAIDPISGEEVWSVRSAPGLDSVNLVIPAGDVVVGFGTDCMGETFMEGYDAADGSSRWLVATGPVGQDVVARIGVADGVLVVPSEGGVTGLVPETGAPVWTHDAPDLTSFTLAGDTVVLASGRSLDPQVVVESLDIATGEQRWTRTLEGGGYGEMNASADLVVINRWVPPNSTSALIALDAADGTDRWQASGVGAGSDRSFAEIAADGTVVGANDNGDVVGLDGGDGSTRWTLPDTALPQHDPASAIAENPETVFVQSEDGVAAVEPRTGALAWSRSWAEQEAFRSESFELALDGDLTFSSADGELALFDGTSGDEVWRSGGLRELTLDPETPYSALATRDRLYLVSDCRGN